MWERGIVITLRIPNSTEATQDMDDLYHTFKAHTCASKNNAASPKISR